MKGLAFLLILSMGLLGLNRFTMATDSVTPQTELSCNMDCCTNHATWCCNDHSSEEKPKKGTECSGGCDCSYSVQIVAMECPVQSPLDLTPRIFDHVSFQENYYFEYPFPHFQPPRIA
jgi:hypothetical protein